ncbi:hypothetical protein TRAPUB_3521 [Trametes pubescens]|uniref:Heterokaryon incompatibility domain-containing protein n=1 Tax=Trametes pubescens TaxID=154538 RepID=A0A1M2VDI2_TRAPU|nr:hypothetical protein TRAPUB_3521 [Trametes pubescens]
MGPKNSRAPLPPKPSSVCQTCWEGPFAAHLGLFDQKKPLGRAKDRTLEGHQDDPAAPYINARSPILDVGSLQSLSIAKALIDECVETHERCRKVVDPDPLLPTRLIDCVDPGFPRLVATKGRRGSYLALSYVWGEAQPHRTTTTNISAYTNGIDPSVLPQTIRDAIRVTHGLGFRYLWADSLCIIQDSDEDKRSEIGRMHRIYRSAHLTIIAASARRVSEGFLHTRRASPYDITLPFICPRSPPARADGAAGEASARRVGEVCIHPQWIARGDSSSTDLNYYDRNAEPISARGWCLQELYMSPRALIFTSETLQLRCQTKTQNVGNAICVTHATASERTLPDALFRPDAAPVEHGSEEWFDVHARWGDIMKDYALRAIGEPSDKLVACGAIAEAFQRVLRSDYLAGLWRARLLWDLLWHRAPSLINLVRVAKYRAPSWSWAAVDGQVFMWRRQAFTETPVLAEIVRCEVVLKDPELRFGQVTGGYLLLRAVLVRCDLRRSGGWGWHEIAVEEDEAVLEEDKPETHRRMMAFVDDEADAGIESAWLVPLLERRGQYQSMHGLVVVLAEPEPDGTTAQNRKAYRRIGTFDTDIWDVRQGGRVPLAEIKLV